MAESAAPLRMAWVVPCFNEAERLDEAELARLATVSAAGAEMHLVLVNDGSSDDTLAKLRALAARDPAHIAVVNLERNVGKGEAVRAGLRHALDRGATVVGFLDADLSVPVDEALALFDVLCASGADVVLGSRVTMLGREIERHALRHYLGRVFASAASLALGVRVYDTQCGGKLFRATPALRAALGAPFRSRWAFDVELLGRLLSGPEGERLSVSSIVEHPLRVWREKRGSKLKWSSMIVATTDLGWIALELARRRRSARRAGV